MKYFLKRYTIDCKEKNHKDKAAYDQLKKFEIVLWADTVIKPFTMMIKIIDTPVAFCAVKGFLTDASFA